MGRIQEPRRPQPPGKKTPSGPQPEEDEEIKRKREDAEAAALLQRQQEEQRARELDALNTRVDQALSKNSQEFLKGTKQPGGQ